MLLSPGSLSCKVGGREAEGLATVWEEAELDAVCSRRQRWPQGQWEFSKSPRTLLTVVWRSSITFLLTSPFLSFVLILEPDECKGLVQIIR